MLKPIFAASLAALLLSTTSALAETRTLDVAPFTAVEITSGISAVVSIGATQSVKAEAPDAGDFDDFKYEVRGGVLHVWYDWNVLKLFDLSSANMTLTIVAPALDAIASTSGASVDATGIGGERLKVEVTSGARASVANAAATAYDLQVTSGANLRIDGTCDTARVQVTSGAHVEARDLLCADVTAETTTGSSLTITVNGTIDAESTTGASMVVYGGPSVNHLESSTGGSISFPN